MIYDYFKNVESKKLALGYFKNVLNLSNIEIGYYEEFCSGDGIYLIITFLVESERFNLYIRDDDTISIDEVFMCDIPPIIYNLMYTGSTKNGEALKDLENYLIMSIRNYKLSKLL